MSSKWGRRWGVAYEASRRYAGLARHLGADWQGAGGTQPPSSRTQQYKRACCMPVSQKTYVLCIDIFTVSLYRYSCEIPRSAEERISTLRSQAFGRFADSGQKVARRIYSCMYTRSRSSSTINM
eukprot:COSAG05_NODE_106_length_18750_cov_677.083105_13_plen_124_part_00